MIYIFIDIFGETHKVGQLWQENSATQRYAFSYDPEWLLNSNCFPIEPSLQLIPDVQYTKPDQRIFSSIADSVQDAWYRSIIQQRAGKTISELDYLLGIQDFSRFGALRFAEDPNGPFLAVKNRYPIPALFELATMFDNDNAELQALLHPEGNVFRPKATVIDQQGNLLLAKFAQPSDQYSVILWEALALKLAELAGLQVPKFFVRKVQDNNVLFITRFDRLETQRIHYISAIGMLGSADDAQDSYLDLATSIKQNCRHPEQDLRLLWSRIVFNILISNFEDHLRNYGFLYQNGWSSAPLFTAVPCPADQRAKALALVTKIDHNHTAASLDLALSVADQFGLDLAAAKTIIHNIATVTPQWHAIAKEFNIPTQEIAQLASAFEHAE